MNFIVNIIEASRKWVAKDLSLQFMYEKSSDTVSVRAEGVMSRALDVKRSKKMLGWEPRVDLEEELKRVIRWFIGKKPKKIEILE